MCTVLCTVIFKRTGPYGPVFLWLAHLAWPVSVLDRLLSGLIVDRIVGRYLLRPAAGDSMERLLVDAGHVLRGGQDCGRQEQDCKKREGETLAHEGTSFSLCYLICFW